MSGSTMTQPPPRVDARELVEHIVTSGLMDRDEVTRALEGLPPTEKGKTLARHLVETGKLTRFQAERLLIGKTDGFIIGQYRVLEELGRGGMGRVFKATRRTPTSPSPTTQFATRAASRASRSPDRRPTFNSPTTTC